MKVKKYVVGSMNEAVSRIKTELGKEAVIVSQRKIRRPGLAGLFSPKLIEVLAVVENDNDSEINNSRQSEIISKFMELNKEKEEKKEDISDSLKYSIEAIRKAVQENESNDTSNQGVINNKNLQVKDNTNISEESKNAYNDDIKKMTMEMHEMKKLISNINVSGNNEEKNEIYLKLEENDVPEHIIKKYEMKVQEDNSDIEDLDKLKRELESSIKISEEKNEGVMVLVGPTGVGKTTTIAKLAGKLALVDKKKVGLVTVDTYRIGAVDQLRTYAEIMNIPFKVVFTIKEMEGAIKSLQDCDIILVDTTGRSSKNVMQISELRAFIEKTNSDNIHLVVSSTTKNRDLASIVSGYSCLKYNNVIVTKLDETFTYGSILNILETAQVPLSYVTVGQNVPDDIKIFRPRELVNIILGEESIC